MFNFLLLYLFIYLFVSSSKYFTLSKDLPNEYSDDNLSVDNKQVEFTRIAMLSLCVAHVIHETFLFNLNSRAIIRAVLSVGQMRDRAQSESTCRCSNSQRRIFQICQ